MKRILLILTSMLAMNAYAQIPTAGMVAGYSFNGNANDESGNNNHGTVTGATLTTGPTGTPNSAYRFNGSSNYITVPNSATLTPASSITLCAEVKAEGFYTGTCQANAILNKGTSNGTAGHYFLGFSDNAYDNDNCANLDSTHETFIVQMKTDLTSSAPQVYNSYVVKDQWYCVIATFDGTNARIYVDGSLKATVSAPAPLGINSEPLTFGYTTHTLFRYWFKGVIDDIRIYNRVLTNTEIQGYCSFLEGVDDHNSVSSHVTINTLGSGLYELVLDRNYKKADVTIRTVLGQQVYSSRISNNESELINLASFAKGIYLLNITTEEGQYITKLLKE
jgi:hypothetical protein